jgi:hypothetical protein
MTLTLMCGIFLMTSVMSAMRCSRNRNRSVVALCSEDIVTELDLQVQGQDGAVLMRGHHIPSHWIAGNSQPKRVA